MAISNERSLISIAIDICVCFYIDPVARMERALKLSNLGTGIYMFIFYKIQAYNF